jgi:hypothetical protein
MRTIYKCINFLSQKKNEVSMLYYHTYSKCTQSDLFEKKRTLMVTVNVLTRYGVTANSATFIVSNGSTVISNFILWPYNLTSNI